MQVEATYAEIGEQCDRIIIMVPSGAISKSILFGENGVASSIKEGAIVCDMSSVTPVESKECYDGLKAKGVGFLDAPVSGGTEHWQSWQVDMQRILKRCRNILISLVHLHF